MTDILLASWLEIHDPDRSNAKRCGLEFSPYGPVVRKRPVSDKPCYPDRVLEALVGGGLSIVTGLASGSNSSNLEFGQV